MTYDPIDDWINPRNPKCNSIWFVTAVVLELAPCGPPGINGMISSIYLGGAPWLLIVLGLVLGFAVTFSKMLLVMHNLDYQPESRARKYRQFIVFLLTCGVLAYLAWTRTWDTYPGFSAFIWGGLAGLAVGKPLAIRKWREPRA